MCVCVYIYIMKSVLKFVTALLQVKNHKKDTNHISYNMPDLTSRPKLQNHSFSPTLRNINLVVQKGETWPKLGTNDGIHDTLIRDLSSKTM